MARMAMAMRMATMMTVLVLFVPVFLIPFSSRRRTCRLQIPLQLFGAATEISNNVPDVSNAVKIDVELVNLEQDVLVPGDLRIGVVDDVAGFVADLHCDHS